MNLMDQNTLKTLLLYNPWIENPKAWQEPVKKHMPSSFGFPIINQKHSQP